MNGILNTVVPLSPSPSPRQFLVPFNVYFDVLVSIYLAHCDLVVDSPTDRTMSDSKAQIGAPGTTSTSDPSPCPSILPLSRSSSRPSICQDDTCSQKPTPPVQSSASSAFDIEHVPVSNDPRQWSPLRKVRSYFYPSPLRRFS